MCVNGGLLASPFFPLYKSAHFLFYYNTKCVCNLTPILLSAPVSTSHPISFYLPIIFLFSSSTFHFLWLFILRHDQNFFIFFKMKECIWSSPFIYFLISFLFICKPTEQTAGNMCGIALSQIFPKNSVTQLPFLHLFSDHRSCQGSDNPISWEQPGCCLSPVLPPSPL